MQRTAYLRHLLGNIDSRANPQKQTRATKLRLGSGETIPWQAGETATFYSDMSVAKDKHHSTACI